MNDDYSDAVLQEILEAAAGKSGADREAFLQAACAGRPQLRAEVESLLSSLDRDPAFMADPTIDGRPDDRPRIQLPTPVDQDPDSIHTESANSSAEGPGGHIDRYKLLQVIGEGGFGVVYMAEQEHPVRRRVALKVIKPGMDSKQVIARFEAERQALALMDHPNIARVLDAGATESGSPYFVMELVGGVPITEYCDTNNIDMRERLGLFVKVCQAVQHAHQKGIIHRDIKPSNVLVTLHDGVPVPKVIDFGIAKATQARLTEKTLFTEFRHMIGTPAYMSPEQAQVGGIDVDTRSDIYSLGVLLYELLTETTPFDTKALREAAYGEVQRIIREVEPPKPSTRLASLGKTLGAVAAHRRTDPARLSRLVRGELDWIVMKCLEKDRTRRYETAVALADDVRRYLEDKPVAAGPPSLVYSLRKYARGHRIALGIMAAALGAVVAVASGVVYAALRESRQRQEHLNVLRAEQAVTVEQKKRAEAASAEAEAVNRFLVEMLESSNPFAVLPGGRHRTPARAEATIRDVVDDAVRRLDAGALKDQPAIEAALRTTLGRNYRSLGLYQQALAQRRRALELRTRLHQGDHPDVAASWNALGSMLTAVGDYAGAVKAHNEALAMRRRLFDQESVEVAESLNDLGDALRMLREFAGAQQAVDEALRIRRKLLSDDHLNVSDSWMTVGVLLADRGDHVGAERAFRESLRIRRKALGDEHPLLATNLENIGLALQGQSDLDGAEKAFREAIDIERKVLGDDHPYTANALWSLGSVLQAKDDLAGAEQAFREAVRVWRTNPDVRHSDMLFRTRSAGPAALHGLVNVLRAKGDFAGAAAAARDGAEVVLARAEKSLASGYETPALLGEHGEALARLGRFRPALDDYDRAIGLDPTEQLWWFQRACLRLYLGETERYREECRQMVARFAGSQVPEVSERVVKACLLTREPVGELPALASMVEQSLVQEAGHWGQPWFRQTKGLFLYRCGDYNGALEWLAKSEAGFKADQWHALEFYSAMAHQRLGNRDEARRALARGLERTEKLLFREGEGDLGLRGLENWLICQIARQEAERLIGPLP